MTKATDTLREEHRWIRLLLDCLQELVATFRAKGEFRTEAARELQSIFEHFVDEEHQNKEESALFPKLLERVQKLQDDHAEERAHLDRMRFSLFNATLGDPADRERFVEEAETYLAMQRQHMALESLGLLPLAEQLLTAEDDEQMLAEFSRLEGEGLARGELQKRVRALCGELQVPFEGGAAKD